MIEALKDVIEDLKGVIEETGLNEIYDKDIMDFAVRIYLSRRIEEGKDRRVTNIKNSGKEPEKNSNMPKISNEPATEKQIHYLKNQKVNVPENLTKQEAFNLIKKLKETGY